MKHWKDNAERGADLSSGESIIYLSNNDEALALYKRSSGSVEIVGGRGYYYAEFTKEEAIATLKEAIEWLESDE